MITHRLDIQEIAEGFKLVAAAGKSLKIIIEPNKN
jgi:threonine dehydrogenase-like Zn-dependent dehydrogenase